MFEDIVKNLKAPHEAGMKTVLIVAKAGTNDQRDAWEHRQETPPFVEYVTDDIAGFLAPLGTDRMIRATFPSKGLASIAVLWHRDVTNWRTSFCLLRTRE